MTFFPIPKYVQNVLNILNNAGYTAFLAGGCVRDFLMDKTPSDYDIATSSTPLETRKCFSGIYHVVDTGIKHGTVTVVTEDGNIEITTFRTDGDYKDGRHPESVLFSTNIEDDLSRRDFTVNAMAYNEKSGIIDLFSGINHIKKRKICCVGEADRRFSEDALRILRGLRFASVLDFFIEEETAKSIIKNKSLLNKVSKERIFVEFKKLICGKRASEILIRYKDVISEFIPQLLEVETEKYTEICKKIDTLENDINIRLSSYLSVFSSDVAETVLKNLKSDNKTVYFVKNTVKGLNTPLKADKISVKQFLKAFSPDILEAVLKINKSNKISEISEEIIRNNECYCIKQLNVNGEDISKLGIKGKKAGEALEFLLEKVIQNEVENTKKTLLELIKNTLL